MKFRLMISLACYSLSRAQNTTAEEHAAGQLTQRALLPDIPKMPFIRERLEHQVQSVVGLRGQRSNTEWLETECMGLMVKRNVVLTLCACVMSWYTSFKTITSSLKPWPSRDDKFDILADKLFVYSVNPSTNSRIYTELKKPPHRHQRCDQAIKYNSDRILQNKLPAYFEIKGTRAYEKNFPSCAASIPNTMIAGKFYSFGFVYAVEEIQRVAIDDNTVINLPEVLLHSGGLKKASRKCCSKKYNPEEIGCFIAQDDLCGGRPGAPFCTKTTSGARCCMGLATGPIPCNQTGEFVLVIRTTKPPAFLSEFIHVPRRLADTPLTERTTPSPIHDRQPSPHRTSTQENSAGVALDAKINYAICSLFRMLGALVNSVTGYGM